RMRHYLRNTALFLGAFNAIIILYVMFAFFSKPSYTYYPAHYKALARLANDSEVAGRANPRGEKVFIAASIVDKNGELLGGQWGTSMVELVDLLGPNNVYLSVYENGADPRAVGAMRNLSESVQCSSSFVADNLTYDQIRHIELPNGESRVKRIEYLAEVRNRALRPLEQSTPARRAKRNGRRSADSTDVALFESHHGTPAYLTTFDRVLFLNDIYFSPVEATQLLFATNSNDPARNFPRARYRAACAVDFINPFKFYDTFASRDLDGYSMGLPFFPWFSREGSHTSRDDAQAQSDAVRVRSCWGGMAAYEAYWFQDQDRPLRFRAEPGPYWDASECCLVNADLANLPQPPEPELVLDAVWNVSNPGIFMNPFVRVAYDAGAFHWERIARRPEQIYAPVHALLGWLLELPGYNPRRRDVREGGFCGARRILLINERPEVGESRWQRTVVPEPVEATATATPGAGV
ncbi:cryptococcal mannosyltransferase 1-domain-containing protein, partial [Lineolata rhizophorae]